MKTFKCVLSYGKYGQKFSQKLPVPYMSIDSIHQKAFFWAVKSFDP